MYDDIKMYEDIKEKQLELLEVFIGKYEWYEDMKENLDILMNLIKEYDLFDYLEMWKDNITVHLNRTIIIGIDYDFKNVPLLSFPCDTIQFNMDTEMILFNGEVGLNFIDAKIQNMEIME